MRTWSVVLGAAMLLAASGLAPADAASSPASLVVVGAPNTAARLHLSRPVALGEDPFSTPRVTGSDGTFAAVVIRDDHGKVLFTRLVGRVPTSGDPIAMDPLGAVRLGPGDYTVELLGAGAAKVTMQATGLPRSVTLRTSRTTHGWLRTSQYGSSPTGGATVDRVTVPARTRLLFQLQGSNDTINPHSGGASLCSLSAAACAQAEGLGSRNDTSGRQILGVSVVTDGSRTAYFTYSAAHLPPGDLLSEQDMATPLRAWRAVLTLG